MIIKIKKIISLILKSFLPNEIYVKRRETLLFQIYISIELFKYNQASKSFSAKKLGGQKN